jgi:hypothetical protein
LPPFFIQTKTCTFLKTKISSLWTLRNEAKEQQWTKSDGLPKWTQPCNSADKIHRASFSIYPA